MKCKRLVVDTAAFVKNVPLWEYGEELYSLPEVIEEIRDKQTRQRLEAMPVAIKMRQPQAHSVRFVNEFSKKTGDYASLSLADIKVLALTYELEVEVQGGSEHLCSEPQRIITEGAAKKTSKSSVKLAEGFYHPAAQREENIAISTSNSLPWSLSSDAADSECNQLESSLPNSASGALQRHIRRWHLMLMNNFLEEYSYISGHILTGSDFLLYSTFEEEYLQFCPLKTHPDLNICEGSDIQSENNVSPLYSTFFHLKRWASHIMSFSKEERKLYPHSTQSVEELLQNFEKRGRQRDEKESLYSVQKDEEGTAQSKQKDERSTQSEQKDEEGTTQSEEKDKEGTTQSEEKDKEGTAQSEEKDEKGSTFSVQKDEGSRWSVQKDDSLLPSDLKDIKMFSQLDQKADEEFSGLDPLEPTPVDLSSLSLLEHTVAENCSEDENNEEELVGSHLAEEGEDQEEHEEDNDNLDDGSDDEGWITPSNIKKHKIKNSDFVNADELQDDVQVACITADFAVQNVLKHIGLPIIGVDGKFIRHLRTYILRCYACFRTTSVMTKIFCPHCGNKTLKKASVTVNPDGTQKIWINTKRPINIKGTKYSLPTPKGGKHGRNPILVEDQREAKRFSSKMSWNKINPLHEDYNPDQMPFAVRDVYSRAAQLGYIAGKNHHHYYWERKNPNQPMRRTGKKKGK
ncbi:hypothetical protein OTU49_010236 [Cherax quadricarinatus]|uniref:RNA-binding protein NOB1 n=1 Tax=Cherax quadricarinatus TaxID=27406 RepID=A0AAW0W8J4_CHEQU